MPFEVKAGCKVNLYLDIVGVRADGYHEIESLFYPLPQLHDVLFLEERPEPGLVLTCSLPSLRAGENIVSKAYAAFVRATGWPLGLVVHVHKNIPLGAGLGGGSSDAAALLLWLNARAGDRKLDTSELHRLGLSLGADVPFFLQKSPAWVTGVGEILEPIEISLAGLCIVLVCPGVHVNTRWAYQRWDEEQCKKGGEQRKGLTRDTCTVKTLCFTKQPRLWNAFEEVVFREFPVLYEIKCQLLKHGALGCVMSGSGSSIVGVFSSLREAARSADMLQSTGFVCYQFFFDA